MTTPHEFDTPPRRNVPDLDEATDPSIPKITVSPGERGRQGDTGQAGQDGRTGYTGERGTEGLRGRTGETGARGRSLTVWQAMAMFFLILVIGLGLSFFLQRQQHRIEESQRQIATNTLAIQQANYDNCVGGIKIIQQFNKQQTRLYGIEQSLADDPQVTEVGLRIARARMKAYKAAIVDLPPGDKPCGERPR